MNPKNGPEERKRFLQNFKRDGTLLTKEQQLEIEEILVEFHDIFARHKLDIGINNDFKIKLTLKTKAQSTHQAYPAH